MGLNSFLVCSSFTAEDLGWIQRFKAWGADVIEPAIIDPAAVDADALREALDGAGMAGSPLCAAFGDDRDLRGTPEQQRATLDYMSAMIELAAAVGSKLICGPMYSSVGRAGAHTAHERAQQLDLIAGHLVTLAAQAEQAGVVLAIEPLNRFETDCINTIAQATELIEKVGSPAVKIHIDTFHMNIEEADAATAILEAGDLIGHVHASASHRGIPGQDQIDWSRVFASLHAIDYQGDIVIESFSPDNEVIARAASIWRDTYDSPEQLAREGFVFLRDAWVQAGAGVTAL